MENYGFANFLNKTTFVRSAVIVILFFTLTPLALVASTVSLIALAGSRNIQTNIPVVDNIINANSGAQIFASLPSSFPSVSGEVVGSDARPELIRQYLERYNSPLVQHAELLVETADKYQLDYRLLTAIAQQESNLCKRIPPGSYNCWGWGIHSRGTLMFSSYEEGIETVSKGLKENYIDKGFVTPDQIMKKYTPLSPGSWARGVNLFMDQMR
jgi:hypothetical protein